MLSSLLRPKKGRRRVEHSPFSSHYADQSSPLLARNERVRHATADFTETEFDEDNTEDEEDEEDQEEDHEEIEVDDDEDGHDETPLLPIFSAAHLGSRFSLLLQKYRC
jgi:hypothetical protein